MEDKITIKEHNYRIKKMNAIEMLAIQSQISFDSADESYACYSQILERCEVQCNDKWLPVKEKGKGNPHCHTLERPRCHRTA